MNNHLQNVNLQNLPNTHEMNSQYNDIHSYNNAMITPANQQNNLSIAPPPNNLINNNPNCNSEIPIWESKDFSNIPFESKNKSRFNVDLKIFKNKNLQLKQVFSIFL